jgi:hypothetical protein
VQTALDFFQEHLGALIGPGSDPKDVLMRGYPHFEKDNVRVRMGGAEPARFLVSATSARVWAPVRLPLDREGRVSVAPTSSRKRRDWLVDVIMDPPETPFLAASLGMSAADADHWRLTVSPGAIVFSGAAALLDGDNMIVVERERFVAAKDWFASTKVPVSDLLRRRDLTERFRRGAITGDAARNAMARIKTPREMAETYPGPEDSFQMRLAAHAANEWTPA